MIRNILFVCTGNSCRSVMAEGLFKKLTEGREDEFRVASVGVSAYEGNPPTAPTVHVMKEEGVDVTEHRSRRLTPETIKDAHKIYVMEEVHRKWILNLDAGAETKVHLLSDYLPEADKRMDYPGIPDPIQMPEYFYRNVLGMIRSCVQKIVEEL